MCYCFVLFFVQFANAHGNSEITTLAQDATETRLFTASADGTVKVELFHFSCFCRFPFSLNFFCCIICSRSGILMVTVTIS